MSLDNNNILGRLALIPLPSAPDVLLRLLSSLSKEGTTFDEIAQIIGMTLRYVQRFWISLIQPMCARRVAYFLGSRRLPMWVSMR